MTTPLRPTTGREAPDTKIPLLTQMQRDLREHGTLRAPTIVAMYLAYTGHAALTSAALHHRWLPLGLPRTGGRVTGSALAAVGTGLCALGMRRFSGPGQVSGSRTGALVTGGVYRHSRNPQYLGYTLALTGLALARRSGAALGCAALAAAGYNAWVPIEETHLERTLGDPYLQYRDGTSRWWGPAAVATGGADGRADTREGSGQ